MNNVKADLRQARTLIQQKKYEDAKAMLVTIDHPTADKWLAKLNTLTPSVAPLAEKDYSTRAIVLIVLYFILFLPGLIAGHIWSNEARQDIEDGRPVRGAQTLIGIHKTVIALMIAGLVLFITIALIGSARLNGSSII